MRGIAAIALRELQSLFLSPLAWSVLGIVQGVAAYLFLSHVQLYLSVQEKLAMADNAPGFTALIVPGYFADAAVMLIFAVPLLTMRAVSEERRNKTLTLLLAAPLSAAQIVAGKALGNFGFIAVVAALLTAMPCVLAHSGALDFGMLAANALALLLVAGLFVAVGLFASCLTRYPALAALAATGLLLLLWLLDSSGGLAQRDSAMLQYLSLASHFRNLQSGLVDSADVLYFLIAGTAFLALAVYQLQQQRLQP